MCSDTADLKIFKNPFHICRSELEDLVVIMKEINPVLGVTGLGDSIIVRRGDGCKPSIPDDTDFSGNRGRGVSSLCA